MTDTFLVRIFKFSFLRALSFTSLESNFKVGSPLKTLKIEHSPAASEFTKILFSFLRSITIDDVVFVVDAGKVKEKVRQETQKQRLQNAERNRGFL